MNTTACDREPEVLDRIMSGQWPPVDDDLRNHADDCPVCAELAAVATILHDERNEAFRDARLPTSGQVWWRATMRTRAEGAARAARPITVLQGVAGACAAGLCAVLVTLAWSFIRSSLAWTPSMPSLGEMQTMQTMQSISAVGATLSLLSLVAVLGAIVILTPFVLYLVLSDE